MAAAKANSFRRLREALQWAIEDIVTWCGVTVDQHAWNVIDKVGNFFASIGKAENRMANRAQSWLSWGKQFKAFRLRAGYASQDDFADAFSHVMLASGNHLVLSSSQISRWENGQRCPSKREQHLELITGLVQLGGILTREEADAWLQAGDWRVLSEVEFRPLFGNLGKPIVEHRPLAELPMKVALPPDAPVVSMAISAHQDQIEPVVDWGDAPTVPRFQGRQAEFAQLSRYLVGDGCRVVAILGMGGAGKTTLAAHLAREVAGHFDGVLWRSLLNAPPLDDILRTWLLFLSRQQLAHLPASLDERLHLLVGYLHSQRYLLVLDNCEAILQDGERTGHYRPGYEGYGELLRWMAEQQHTSCLLLTSREQPREISRLKRESTWIRTVNLAGLEPEAGRALLQTQGLQVPSQLGEELVARYSGNPLALKLVVDTIQELFAGDVASFLEQETPLFDDIRDVLDQQFARLSQLEKDILLWLAIEREPVSLQQLERDLVPPASRGEVLTTIRTLQRRSLLERADLENKPTTGPSGVRFALQNVVVEYLSERLVATAFQEILLGQAEWLNRYALLKAQAKEHVRQSQERLFLQPLARQLVSSLGSAGTGARLKRILDQLRTERPLAPGHTAGNILNLLLHLRYDLRGYDFSQLAVWQANLRGMAVQDVDFSHADLSGASFTDTFGGIAAVVFSPDGRYLAAAAISGEVRLWQTTADSSSPIAFLTCAGHKGPVRCVSFSPDGRTLASSSDDQTVRLWDAQTGDCLRIWQGHTHAVWSVCFSPDGNTLATGSVDQTVRLWDIETHQCLHIFEGHINSVISVCFSPDGNTLASGSGDRTVRLWDIQTGICLVLFEGHGAWVRSVDFSSDGRTLASGSEDQTVRLWDVHTGHCLHTLQGHTNSIWSVCFSPDCRTLASGSHDHSARLWDAQTGQCLRILQGHTNSVWSVGFSPDGHTLATGSEDQTVRLWDVQTATSLYILQGHTNSVWSVCYSPDGRILATGSGGVEHTVRLWDPQTGECLHSCQGHSHMIWSLCFSPDGRILASGSGDQTVRLWDVHTGQCLHILQGHTGAIISVSFSPDGRTLVSGSDDQAVRLWDVQTGAWLHSLPRLTNWVWSVCFSPDGRTLASGSDDQTVRLWDVDTGQCLHVLSGHTGGIRSVCFSPDGRILASGSGDCTVRLWDAQGGESLYILQGHTHAVLAVCFSPDGHTLASSGGDQTVRLWDIQAALCLHVFEGHSAWVWSVCFSPDGRTLASGSEDQAVRMWDVDTGSARNILRGTRPYERMNISGVRGLSAAQRVALKALGAIENLICTQKLVHAKC